GAFKIMDVTADGTNVYLHANLTGGFPPVSGSPPYAFVFGSAPSVSFTNCNGTWPVTDLSQPGAQGKPLVSYSKFTLTGNGDGVSTFNLRTASVPFYDGPYWGKVVSITINVSKAYTGSQPSLNFSPLSPYWNYPLVNSDGTVTRYGPNIDLKT